MLNRHVVTFLDETIFSVYITSRSYYWLCWPKVVQTMSSFSFKPPISRFKRSLFGWLHRVVRWLWTGSLILTNDLAFVVLARSWHIEFQTLAIMRFVEMESRRGLVESNLLADVLFKVRCSHLLFPIRLARRW